MENSRFRPDEEDNEDKQATPKKRRGGDFLSEFLLRRQEGAEQTADESETEDDDEETEPTSKKWRKFLKNLFKDMSEPVKPEPEHSFDSAAWFGWQAESPVPQTEVASNRIQTSEVIEDSDEELPEPVIQPEMIVTEAEVPEGAVTERRAETTVFPLEMTQQGLENHSRETMAVTSESIPVERARQETVVERSGGVPLVLLGAEYLARKHADRKLERKLSEQVKHTDEKVEHNQVLSSQLENLIVRNQQQLEELKQHRAATTETRPAVPLSPEIAPQTPEAVPDPVAEKISAPDLDKDEPKRVFEQVAQAAERNVPVERIFERSHEIKDERTTSPATATSVGAVITAQKHVIQPSVIQKPNRRIDSGGLPIINDAPTVATYKQAMMNGFVTAVALLVVGTIAYLVLK